MKKWNVLPTDPRYQELTAEQRALLWEDFLLDNPDIAEKVEKTVYDDEFDQLWEELDKEEKEDSSEVWDDDWEEVEDEGGEA